MLSTIIRVVVFVVALGSSSRLVRISNAFSTSSTSPHALVRTAAAHTGRRGRPRWRPLVLFSTTTVETPSPSSPSNATLTESSPSSSPEEESFDWDKQWYPVLPLASLSSNSQSVTPISILNRPLVVWKNSQGRYSILDDKCPHRRAPLSTGRISNDGCSLACRYHGWEFNASGTCTKIPMLQEAQQAKCSKFGVTSYPTQQAGGLLWVFMDPTVESPPPIPSQALIQNNRNDSTMLTSTSTSTFMCNKEPVSYLSMIENSFDPAHAPFTHAGTMNYSPDTATPMQEYQFLEKLSLQGFEMQHSPYQKSPAFGSAALSSDSNNTTKTTPMAFTKRRFIPPCTNVFEGPFLSGILYFVPSKPGETNSIAHFSLSSSSGKKKKQSRQQSALAFLKRRVVPASWQSLAKDCMHVLQWTSDANWRFASQDRLNMQGQDMRKLQHVVDDDSGSSSAPPPPAAGDVTTTTTTTHRQQQQQERWDDLVPTTSDAGVAAFQKWMRKYGGGGPFDMATMAAAAAANTQQEQERTTSIWGRHGKTCDACQRTMKRLASWEQRAKRWSMRTFLVSAIGALYAAVSATVTSSFFSMWRRTSSSAIPAVAALSWSILALVASVGLQFAALASHRLQQRMLNTPHVPSIQMMDIYQEGPGPTTMPQRK